MAWLPFQKGFNNDYIDSDELKAMDPSEKNLANSTSYSKSTKTWQAQFTPGLSGCGSISSLFVDAHAKHLVQDLPSYLQDTPDLLRHIQELNKEDLPENAFPVSIDVVSLHLLQF